MPNSEQYLFIEELYKKMNSKLFELYIYTLDDLTFYTLEKRVNHSRDIIWVAEAQVDTSWGRQMDPALNFIYSFIIDATTGEILEIEVLSGH